MASATAAAVPAAAMPRVVHILKALGQGGADAASAGAIESTEDATETPSAGVDANAFGDETPAEFGGGDAGAPEMGVYDDWATTETSGGGDAVDGGRWDASRVDPMTTETESAAAAAFPVVSDERVETATTSSAFDSPSASA